MTILFEKHPLTVSPALAPRQPREADEFDRPQNDADAVLTIGLINNMPDSALQATERQFTQLLKAGAGNSRIHLHCLSLPSVKRTPSRTTWRTASSQAARLKMKTMAGSISRYSSSSTISVRRGAR